MSKYVKREIPLMLCFIAGMINIAQYFFNIPELTTANTKLNNWVMIMGGTMIGLGTINLFMIHIRRVQRRTAGQWPFSIWLMFGILFSIVLGFWEKLPWNVPVLETVYNKWLYINVNMALSITIFSLFGFYVVSATIHALQLRSLESALFMFGAVVVFLWNAPLGGVIWEGFLPFGSWISANITGSTFRAVTIVMAIGILSLGIRILLGQERGWLGVES